MLQRLGTTVGAGQPRPYSPLSICSSSLSYTSSSWRHRFGHVLVLLHDARHLQLPFGALGPQRPEVERQAQDFGKAPRDGLDAQRISALQIAGNLGHQGRHLQLAGAGPRHEVAGERSRPLVAGAAQAVALHLRQQGGVGAAHVQPRLPRVRRRAAERADEQHPAHADPPGDLQDAVAELAPADSAPCRRRG